MENAQDLEFGARLLYALVRGARAVQRTALAANP